MTTTQGTSTSAVLTSLSASAILFGCFVGGFIVLRLRFKRVYSPKASFELVPEEKRPEPLPKDPFRWVYILLTKPHSFLIQQCGLDGYFFLRYLFIFMLVFTGGILTWVVLFPVNAIGGNSNSGLDYLSISNVTKPRRYYAHAIISLLFYGTVIYIIYRELFFYTSFRNAALSLPRYATKRSLRTVLFQLVPDHMLDEKQFFKLFNGVKRVYVSRNTRLLSAKVRDRQKLAFKLEAATTKLIKKAVHARMKAAKKGQPVENTDLDHWVPRNKRPRQKLGGLFSKKVDTIETCRAELAELDASIKKLQRKFRLQRPKNSLFVEFDDQYSAQIAYQTVVHHNPMRMTPLYIGMEPGDVDWVNLRLFWWEHIVRKALAAAAVVALVIFWAIPVAFVGVISNINSLTNKLPWLDWINDMPSWLLGFITGLLPTVLLALLLAILPMFIRAMAKVAGCPTTQSVENFTHKAYFAFLTVNGFLVTALASSATSAVTAVIDDPSSALDILATNLPRSSNFYVSYLALQGLAVTGGALFQVVGFVLYYVLGALLDGTLRKKWARFSGLGSVAWGTTFPVVVNLASITMVYAIIAPMIFLFAAVAFALMYVAWCHNLSYVFVESADSRGSHYPMALFQTFTGIYIGQVCLLGLYIVGKGWGPIVIQAIGLGITIFAHLHMKTAFDRLVTVVPVDCMKPLDGVSNTPSARVMSDFSEKMPKYRKSSEMLLEMGKDVDDRMDADNVQQHLDDNVAFGKKLTPLLADRDFKKTESNNVLVKWIRPDVFLNYRHTKQMIPALYNIETVEDDDKHAYDQPDISAQMPVLWIPKDAYGWSTHEIELNSGVVEMKDTDSAINEKGKVMYLGPPPY